jgi:hypothetical protein
MAGVWRGRVRPAVATGQSGRGASGGGDEETAERKRGPTKEERELLWCNLFMRLMLDGGALLYKSQLPGLRVQRPRTDDAEAVSETESKPGGGS